MKDPGNFVVSAALIVLVLGLGIWRLNFDRSAPVVDEQQRASLASCIPPTELPAGAKVTAFLGAPGADAAGAKLDFVSTTAIRLDGTIAGGSDKDPLRIRKAAGGFELWREDGTQPRLQLRSNGVVFNVAAADAQAVRFGPTDEATYEVVLDQPKDVTQTDGTRTLVAGARGKVIIGDAVAVQILQPLRVLPNTGAAPAVLHPIRVSGQPGLSDIAVEINQPGLRVDDGTVKLFACSWLASTKTWEPAGVSSTRASDGGGARLLIALPTGAFPVGRDWHHPVSVAVASSDGRYVAVGSFTAVSRPWAAVAATALSLALLATLMILRGRQLTGNPASGTPWFSGLFTGADGDPSLSLWQTFVWTVVTVWGLLYVFIVAGSLLTLTPEVMGLLGIAGTGSVLARWIASHTGSTSRTPAAATTGPQTRRPHLFWQMLSTNGSFDLLKLQLFIFTVTIAMYVVGRIADAAAFPTLDVNTLLLMGVSQGVYLTSKAVGASTVARAQTLKAQFDAGAEQLENLRGAISLRKNNQTQVDADVAAKGAAADPELLKRQTSLKAEIDELQRQLQVAETRQAALKLDFDKAVAELGLVVKT